MTISPLAGKPAPKEMLVDPARLEREYFERQPDLDDPEQRVSFRNQRASRLVVARLIHRSPYSGHHPSHLRLPAHAGHRWPAVHGTGYARAFRARPAHGARSSRRQSRAHRHSTERRRDSDAGHLTGNPCVQSRAKRASRRRHCHNPVAQPSGGWRLQVQSDSRRSGRSRRDPVDRDPGQQHVTQRQFWCETGGLRRSPQRRNDAAARFCPALRGRSAQHCRYGGHSRRRPQARRRPARWRRRALLGTDQRDL